MKTPKEVYHRWQLKHSVLLMLCLCGEGTFLYLFHPKALHELKKQIVRCFFCLKHCTDSKCF